MKINEKKNSLHFTEVESVAASLCKVSEDLPSEKIEQALIDKYGVDIETFTNILQEFYGRMELGVSPISNSVYIGLVNPVESVWIIKRDISSFFIGSVLSWVAKDDDGGNEDIDEALDRNPQGIAKDIIVDGEPKYKLILRRCAPMQNADSSSEPVNLDKE